MSNTPVKSAPTTVSQYTSENFHAQKILVLFGPQSFMTVKSNLEGEVYVPLTWAFLVEERKMLQNSRMFIKADVTQVADKHVA